MKVKLEDVERFERHVKMRLAFRFGVITVTDATQAVIRVRISLPDGRTSHGVAAEALAAKWFEKSPAFTDAQNLDQLRQALDLAIELYRAQGFAKPFDLFAGTYAEQHKRGAMLGLNPLVASYGPALLDRAILDALGRATGQSFATMIARNVPGIRTTSLTPDIADADLGPFLSGLVPAPSIEVRHTVGLVDPLTGRRPAGGGARERRTAGDPRGGRVLLSRPLLQAEGRRRHQGRSRAAGPHRRRARRRRRRLPHDPRRQRAVRRRRGHRRTVAQGRGDAGLGQARQVDPVHRAADQAGGRVVPFGGAAWRSTAP